MTDKADSEFRTIRNAMNNKFIEYVCQWRKEHPDEYEEFRKGVSAISAGDTSTFERLFEVIMTCIPRAVINECMAFFGVQSATDDTMQDDEYCMDDDEMQELLSFEGYFKLRLEGDEFNADLVAEKEDPLPPYTWYFRIRRAEDWWRSLPMLRRTMITWAMKKREEEVVTGARRILIVSYMHMVECADRLVALAYKEKNPLLMSGLYYIMMDHGLRDVSKQIGSMNAQFRLMGFMKMFVTSSIGKLASDSIRQGYDRKADWENDFDDVEDPDVRREVMRTIAETPGRKGRPHLEQKEYSIDDCLIAKDKEALKKQILAVLGEMQHDYDLAFIREALRCSNHLTAITYPFFHHAICVFSGMEFKYDRAQRMSTLIEFRHAEFVASHDPRNLRGKRMIRLWTDMFGEVE